MKKITISIFILLLFTGCSREDCFFIFNATNSEIEIIYELVDDWKNKQGYFYDTPGIVKYKKNNDDFEFIEFIQDSTLITKQNNIVKCRLPVNTYLHVPGGQDFSKFDRANNEKDFQRIKTLKIIRDRTDTTTITSKTLADIVQEHEKYDVKLTID